MGTHVELTPEVKAIAELEAALGGLEDAVRARVLRWALERFGLGSLAPAIRQERQTGKKEGGDGEKGGRTVEQDDLGTLSEFYGAASPTTDSDKVLVAGYWFQFREGAPDLEAQKLNSQLKHLGHQVGNVTRAFSVLISQKPQLVVQLRKEGSTKQARKKYKLTNAGKLAVEAMLKATDG